MKYYKLTYDYEIEKVILCYSNELFGIDRYDVEKGKPINGWRDDIMFYYKPSEGEQFTDYLGNDLAWFVISSNFKTALENLGIGGMQYLPISIVNEVNKQMVGEFYVANVCNLVDALDLDKSEYDIIELDDEDEEEKMLCITFYALKKSELNGLDIFRVKDDYVSIFISESVKNAILNNKITGCVFDEVTVT